MMGTEKGLYLFDRKKNKVVDFPHAEALTGKQTCGIVRRPQGRLLG